MTRPLLFALPGNEAMTRTLAGELEGEIGLLEMRSFPDDETYLCFGTDLEGRVVILVCTLDRPDAKFLKLAFTAATARVLGAGRVGLVARPAEHQAGADVDCWDDHLRQLRRVPGQ